MAALFLKECKSVGKSLVYWLFILITAVFLYAQMPDTMTERIEKPQPGQASYGQNKFEENPEILMPAAGNALLSGFMENDFVTYPTGFYKKVKLNDKKRAELAKVLSELTTYSQGDLLAMNGSSGDTVITPDQAAGDGTIQIGPDTLREQTSGQSYQAPEGLSYERFRELMEQADRILGGGSAFDPDGNQYKQFCQVPWTYEEALENYNAIVNQDRVSGAYARVFCDFLGCMLGILPVFVAVAMGMRDSRGRVRQLIYARGVSSTRLVLTRFCAQLAMMFLPVLVMFLGAYTALLPTYQGSGLALDNMAFIKYAFGWSLPTLLIACAVGFSLTELTDSPIAIVVQGIWWFIDMFSGMGSIYGGDYAWSLIPRHNKVGNTGEFLSGFSQLVQNRLFYVGLSIVLVLLTILIYELKRRGRLDVWGKIRPLFGHSKIKSKA